MDDVDPGKHLIVSIGSRTTDALAAVVKVLRENWGITAGLISTVHAYTNSHSLTDQPMRDRRASWTTAENITASSSGAAKAPCFIWPTFQMMGSAYGVPLAPAASSNSARSSARRHQRTGHVTPRAAVRAAPSQGVMGALEDERASNHIVGDPLSSQIDLSLVAVIDE